MKNIIHMIEISKKDYLKKSFIAFIIIGVIEILIVCSWLLSGDRIENTNYIIMIGSVLMIFISLYFNVKRAKLFYQDEITIRCKLLPSNHKQSTNAMYRRYEILFAFLFVLWVYVTQVITYFAIIVIASRVGIFDVNALFMNMLTSLSSSEFMQGFIITNIHNAGVLIMAIVTMTLLLCTLTNCLVLFRKHDNLFLRYIFYLVVASLIIFTMNSTISILSIIVLYVLIVVQNNLLLK